MNLRRLARDERGMLPVFATLMLAVLAAGIEVYFVHVAGQVLDATAAQSTADGFAIEGAIWHADGMNILVLINVTMAAILAVFVALRLGTLIFALATTLFFIMAAFPPTAAFGSTGASFSLRATQFFQRMENKVAPTIMRVLKKAADVERVVAAVTPYVAAVAPVMNTVGGKHGISFSISLVPKIETPLKDLGFVIPPSSKLGGGLKPRVSFPIRMGSISKLNSSAGQKAYGALTRTLRGKPTTNGASGLQIFDTFGVGSLPAQEEDYFMVCSRAAEIAASLVVEIAAGKVYVPGHIVDKAVSMFSQAVGVIPTIACTPLKEINASMERSISDATIKACENEKTAYEKTGKKWTFGLQQDCEKRQKDRVSKSQQGQSTQPSDPKAAPSPDEIKTAAIWGEMLRPQRAPFLRTWGWDFGHHRAHAEFYHVCGVSPLGLPPQGPAPARYDKDDRMCSDNAMWRFGWTHTHVVDASFMDELKEHFGALLTAGLARGMGKLAQGAFARFAAHIGSAARSKPGSPFHVDTYMLSKFIGGPMTNPEAGNNYITRKVIPSYFSRNFPLGDVQLH